MDTSRRLPITLCLAITLAPLLVPSPAARGQPALPRAAPPQAANTVSFVPIGAEPAPPGAAMAYAAQEGARLVALKVRLSSPAAQVGSVAYATEDASATAAGDFTDTSGTLTFYPGEQEKIIGVPIADDAQAEGDELFRVALSAPSGLALGERPAAEVTIGASDTIGFAQPATIAYEISGRAVIPVQLQGSSAVTVTVDYATSPGSASAADFTATTGTLVFPPGETWREIPVTLKVDSTSEPTETFSLALSNPVGATLADSTPHSVDLVDSRLALLALGWEDSIGDRDGIPDPGEQLGITVTLSNLSTQTSQPFTSSLRLIGGGAAVDAASASYPAIAGKASAAASFRITVDAATAPGTILQLEQTVRSAGQDFTIPIRIPVGKVGGPLCAPLGSTTCVRWVRPASPVTEGDKSAVFDLRLSAPAPLSISISYISSYGNAQVGRDLTGKEGTVTFAPGEVNKSFRVSITDDKFNEPAEQIALRLYAPSGTVIDGPPTSELVIFDNGDPMPNISLSDYTGPIPESWKYGGIPLTLSANSGYPVRLDYVISSGTAIAGEDFEPISGTLVLEPNENSNYVSFPIFDDTLPEPDETYNITISNPVYATMGKRPTTAITIGANDTISFDGRYGRSSGSAISEGNGDAWVWVYLSGISAVPVTVDYTTEGGGTATPGADYTPKSGTLTFAPGQTEQRISIPIANDGITEDAESIVIQLSNPTNAGLAYPNTAYPLTIYGNQRVEFSNTALTASERANSVAVTVRLNAPSTSQVSVQYATVGGSATPGSDYTAVSGKLTFPAGVTSKTIMVPLLEDIIAEGSETITLALSSPSHVVLGISSVATITIPANDLITLENWNAGFEGSFGRIAVRLSASSYQQITVDYIFVDGTARAGADYPPTSGTLVFPPGSVMKELLIPILDDNEREGEETVIIRFSNPINAELGTMRAISVPILESD